jgi:hypothetical protein
MTSNSENTYNIKSVDFLSDFILDRDLVRSPNSEIQSLVSSELKDNTYDLYCGGVHFESHFPAFPGGGGSWFSIAVQMDQCHLSLI